MKYGSGRLVYCAAALGAANYEAETSYLSKWTFSMDKVVDAFNGKMLDLVLREQKLQFTPVQMPGKVLASVYRQEADGKTSTLVHLLNAGGTTVALGATVPAMPPLSPAWPALKEDIVFEIALPGLKDACVVSPDFPDRLKATFEAVPGGRYSVSVPKDSLKCYSIVYLEQ